MVLDKEQKRYPLSMAMLQALPAAGLATYVFGFLATNIHLGKFGIFEFDLISSRYVLVGILYFFFVASWYCFAGQFFCGRNGMTPDPKRTTLSRPIC